MKVLMMRIDWIRILLVFAVVSGFLSGVANSASLETRAEREAFVKRLNTEYLEMISELTQKCDEINFTGEQVAVLKRVNTKFKSERKIASKR